MSVPTRSRVRDVLLGAGIFLALGPAIGFVVFFINFTVRESMHVDPVVGPMMLSPSLGYLLGAYVFGGLPCVLAGVVAGFFRARIGTLPSYLAVGLLCAGLAAGPLLVFGKQGGLVSALLFFGLPGLVAGVVCAWVLRSRAGSRPR